MASRKPYECYRCRDNGYPSTTVYLAGKDQNNKTVYVEENGLPHQHKVKQQQPAIEQSSITQSQQVESVPKMTLEILYSKLDEVSSKVDRLLNLIYARTQPPQQQQQ